MTKQEFLAVVYAFDKFTTYFQGTKVVVHMGHTPILHLLAKKEAKPRLIC